MPIGLPSSAVLGDRGEEVRHLQDVLVAVAVAKPDGMPLAVDLGDIAGALEAERTDKIFGEATREAVVRFQKAAGVDAGNPGQVDVRTTEQLTAFARDLPNDPRDFVVRDRSRAKAFETFVAPLGAGRLAIDRLVGAATSDPDVGTALRTTASDPWAVRGAVMLSGLLAQLGPEEFKGGVVDEAWFSHGGAPNDRVQWEAARTLQTLLVAAAAGAEVPKGFGDTAVRLMFVQHPALQMVRDILFGKALPEDAPGRSRDPKGWPMDPGTPGSGGLDPRIPKWADFDRFRKEGCVADLASGLNRVGGALGGLPKPQTKVGAVVTGLRPRSACSGTVPAQRVTITGVGFGQQRPGDAVFFNDTRAEVVLQWSDREIIVEVPDGLLGEVCVNVLENTRADLTGLADAVGAANETSQVLHDCFGVSLNLGTGLFGVYTPRADCTPDNRLWVGPPAIDSFLANGSNQLAKIGLNGSVELSWSTRFADTVTLSVVGIVGPLDPALRAPATPVGATGRQSFGPVPRRETWEVEYTLTARNSCGVQTRSVRVAFGLQVGVAFVGTGTRAVFHAGAMEYLATHLTAPPRGVASGGMGAMAALTMAQDFRNPAPLIAAWNSLAVANFVPTRPFDGMSAVTFLLEEDPAIRQIFQDFEGGMYADMLEAVYALTNEILMSYADAPLIELPDIDIADSDAIVAQKINKAMEDSFWTVAKILASNAMDSGGAPSTKLAKFGGKLAGESVEAVFATTVSGAAKTGIVALGKAAFSLNPAVGVAVILVGFLVKAGVEAGLAVDKAKKMKKALDSRGLARTARLQGLFDDLIQRLNLQNRTVGTSVHVALGAAALEMGEPVYFGGFGNLMTARGSTLSSTSPGWGTVLSAVSSIPGAMAPAKVGGVNVIDTTAVDYAPLEPLHRLGVDEIICVHSTLTTLASPEPPENFDDAGFLSVVRRAERIRSSSAALTAVDPFVYWRMDDAPIASVGQLPARVRHIVPTMVLPLLNAFDYEPGLSDIWQDYGFMRAFDVLAPLRIFPIESAETDRKRRELRNQLALTSDLITATREMCWHLEHLLNEARAVSAGFTNQRVGRLVVTLKSLEDMERLRALKRSVANLVTRRVQLAHDAHRLNPGSIFPGNAVPGTRFAAWFQRYERHPWSFGHLNHTDLTGGTDETPWMTISGFNDPRFPTMINAAPAPVVTLPPAP